MDINQVKSIAKATVNSITGIDEDLQRLRTKRLKVCEACPLFVKSNTRNYCTTGKAVNNKTGAVISTSSPNYNTSEYTKGCGCTLDQKKSLLPEKTTVIGKFNTCPLKKWDSVEKEMFLFNTTGFKGFVTDYISKNKLKVELRKLLKEDLIELGFKDYKLQIKPNVVLAVEFSDIGASLYVNNLQTLKANFSKEDLISVIQSSDD